MLGRNTEDFSDPALLVVLSKNEEVDEKVLLRCPIGAGETAI